MAIAGLREAAVAELRAFVEDRAAAFPALSWVWSALNGRGKLLAEGDGFSDGFSWGVLPLLICEAAGGHWESALPLSTAAECFIAAADTLDDVQDGDAPAALWRASGLATATNVSTFLLFLSQLAIGRLQEHGLPATSVAEISNTFAAAGARACGGQQRDIDQWNGRLIAEGQYLPMIADKSGSLVQCICQSGAIVAGAERATVEAYAQFGLYLGVALQIANDVEAIASHRVDRGDLRIGKQTLPAIFALESAPPVVRGELASLLHRARRMGLAPKEVERVHELVLAAGGVLYATVVGDVYHERALNQVKDVMTARGGDLLAVIAHLRGH